MKFNEVKTVLPTLGERVVVQLPSGGYRDAYFIGTQYKPGPNGWCRGIFSPRLSKNGEEYLDMFFATRWGSDGAYQGGRMMDLRNIAMGDLTPRFGRNRNQEAESARDSWRRKFRVISRPEDVAEMLSSQYAGRASHLAYSGSMPRRACSTPFLMAEDTIL